jgi:uncharacterized protein (DUF433 family)
MADDLIHDRGRGPELVGTRVTVYNLLPHFLDATATEASICQRYSLTPEQVAAARAYVLNHADAVLAEHLRIEERLSAGNPPEVIERAEKTRAAFLKFKKWLAECDRAEGREHPDEPAQEPGQPTNGAFPSYREWLAEQESRAAEGR